MDKNEAKKLDKYYTVPECAEYCYKIFKEFVDRYEKYDTIVEPSAGCGSFFNLIEGNKVGYDLFPEHPEVIEQDFLKLQDIPYNNPVFIGNPPFGTKGDLAINFINHCFDFGNIVGFILPLQFRKYSTHKKINPRAKLLLDIDLDPNSFTLCSDDYSIRSSFQIWGIGEFYEENLRIKDKPILQIQEFDMWQYNRTEAAKKYFDYDWDFAVTRQGYYDYSELIFKKEELNPKRQYIFFRARNDEVLNRLLKLDFSTLSQMNSGIPGFGKADVIRMYLNLYGKSDD